MNFLSNLVGSKTNDASDAHSIPSGAGTGTGAGTGHPHDNQSSSEMFSNAKVVANATSAKLNHTEFDEGKAAEAAADLIDGASHFAKVDESRGIGKYVNQAEDYLHEYGKTHPSHSTSTDHGTTNTTAPPPSSGGEHGKSEGGGLGDYAKMAQGFLGGGKSS